MLRIKKYLLIYKRESKLILIFFTFIIILLFGIFSGPVSGKTGYLSDIVVTNNRDFLLLYFKVKDCFTDDINKAIRNGILTTFTFYIRLYEERPWSPDKKLVEIEVKHSIQYDSIKKLYELRLTEKGNQSIWLSDLDEAKRLLSSINSLKVSPLRYILKDRRYRIKMMVELDKLRLPFKLHYVFFFLSWWDFKTDWYIQWIFNFMAKRSRILMSHEGRHC